MSRLQRDNNVTLTPPISNRKIRMPKYLGRVFILLYNIIHTNISCHLRGMSNIVWYRCISDVVYKLGKSRATNVLADLNHANGELNAVRHVCLRIVGKSDWRACVAPALRWRMSSMWLTQSNRLYASMYTWLRTRDAGSMRFSAVYAVLSCASCLQNEIVANRKCQYYSPRYFGINISEN